MIWRHSNIKEHCLHHDCCNGAISQLVDELFYPYKIPNEIAFSTTLTHRDKYRNMKRKKNRSYEERKRKKGKKRPRRENGNCSINITSIVNLKQCSYFAFAINKISCSIFGCAMCHRIKCGKCM